VRTSGEPVLEQFAIWLKSEEMLPPVVSRVSWCSNSKGKHISLAEIEPVRQTKARELAEALLAKK